jgi:2-oxoglutarate dehydrogenase E2 component (dihydrolipoamide succinyltransferase)
VAKEEGATVGVDELLATLDAAEGAEPADEAGKTASARYEEKPAEAAPAEKPADESSAGEPQTSPAARSLAAEHDLPLDRVRGSGPNGRITKEDVLRVIEEGRARAAKPEEKPSAAPTPPAAPKQAPAAEVSGRAEERQRMSRRRQTIARRLVEAQQTTASLTTFNEVDLKAVMDVRKRRQDAFVKKHGVKLGFMSFFTKAVDRRAEGVPRLNAEIQGDEIVLKHYYDIGIAVGAEEGLVVPVVRDADRLSFARSSGRSASWRRSARDGS